MEHLVVCLLVTSIVFGAVSGASINRTKEDEIKRNIQDFKAFVQAIEDMVGIGASVDKKQTSRGKKSMLETDIPVQPAQVEQTIKVEVIQDPISDAMVQKAVPTVEEPAKAEIVTIDTAVEAEKTNEKSDEKSAVQVDLKQELMKDVKDAIINKIDKINKDFNQKTEKISENVETVYEGIINTQVSIDANLDKVKQDLLIKKDEIGQTLNESKEKIVQKVEQIKQEMKENQDKVKLDLKEKKDSLGVFVDKYVLKLEQSTVSFPVKDATTQAAIVEEHAPSESPASPPQTEEVAETNEVKDPASKQQIPFIEQAQNFIQNIVRPPPASTGGQVNPAPGPSNVFEQVGNAVSQTIQNFQTALNPSSLNPPATQSEESTPNRPNIIEQIGSQFQTVAQNVQTGIQNGIQSGIENFQNAIGAAQRPSQGDTPTEADTNPQQPPNIFQTFNEVFVKPVQNFVQNGLGTGVAAPAAPVSAGAPKPDDPLEEASKPDSPPETPLLPKPDDPADAPETPIIEEPAPIPLETPVAA